MKVGLAFWENENNCSLIASSFPFLILMPSESFPHLLPKLAYPTRSSLRVRTGHMQELSSPSIIQISFISSFKHWLQFWAHPGRMEVMKVNVNQARGAGQEELERMQSYEYCLLQMKKPFKLSNGRKERFLKVSISWFYHKKPKFRGFCPSWMNRKWDCRLQSVLKFSNYYLWNKVWNKLLWFLPTLHFPLCQLHFCLPFSQPFQKYVEIK